MMLLAIQAHARHRLATISIRKTLSFNGFSNFYADDDVGAGKKGNTSLALVSQTGDQLNEASRLMEIAKFEEGWLFLEYSLHGVFQRLFVVVAIFKSCMHEYVSVSFR